MVVRALEAEWQKIRSRAVRRHVGCILERLEDGRRRVVLRNERTGAEWASPWVERGEAIAQAPAWLDAFRPAGRVGAPRGNRNASRENREAKAKREGARCAWD